jgi:hypothetical protein
LPDTGWRALDLGSYSAQYHRQSSSSSLYLRSVGSRLTREKSSVALGSHQWPQMFGPQRLITTFSTRVSASTALP